MMLTCIDCGAEFERSKKGPPALRCLPCKQKRNRELQRDIYIRGDKKRNPTIKKPKSGFAKVPCGLLIKGNNGDRCEEWECKNWMGCLDIAVKKNWPGFRAERE